MLGFVTAGCGGKPPPKSPTAPIAATSTDLELGHGDVAAAGRRVFVNYTGWLYEEGAPDHKGTQFDTSVGRPEPFGFTLGAGQVIKGWDQGVVGMRVGGKRRLVIPPDLAYGDEGAGSVIPPGATLVFDVELLSIE
jgi:FKBP-type peptidyl-prolyl cis-trans isomerase FkpA